MLNKRYFSVRWAAEMSFWWVHWAFFGLHLIFHYKKTRNKQLIKKPFLIPVSESLSYEFSLRSDFESGSVPLNRNKSECNSYSQLHTFAQLEPHRKQIEPWAPFVLPILRELRCSSGRGRVWRPRFPACFETVPAHFSEDRSQSGQNFNLTFRKKLAL